MQANQSSLKDFQVLNKLGEGAFGQVFKVKRKKDSKEYALKKVKIGAMKQKQRQNALNQIRILASYDGDYIIGYKEAFYDQTSATLCVVMEFASQGDILKKNQTHLKARTKYKEQQIWKAFVQMTRGLKSLHDKKIMHRDLKCANVFITQDGTYKLGDLNVSKVLKKDLACTQTGTPYYASPQVWKDKPYGFKSDIWSLGCVLYEMCALKPPFTATDLQGLYRKVCAGVFERIPFCYSNDLSNMINSLLKVDPQKRPSADEILNNPIINKKYNGEMNVNYQDECDELLKTLKYNPKDLKGLGKILPKSNYQTKQQRSSHEQVSKKQIQPKVLKPEEITKDVLRASLENNDKKLSQFLEKKRKLQEEERIKKMKLINEQKQSLSKNRQRVLSACGIRKPQNFHYNSPVIAVHKKDQTSSIKQINSVRPTRKDQSIINPMAKMPPKPYNYGHNNINYKLPPKPQYSGVPPHQNQNIFMNNQTSQQREKSRQNLRNIGAQILQGQNVPSRPSSSNNNRIVRSNSQQKVVYPSWWG